MLEWVENPESGEKKKNKKCINTVSNFRSILLRMSNGRCSYASYSAPSCSDSDTSGGISGGAPLGAWGLALDGVVGVHRHEHV